jgi:hypothetical protein
MRFVPAFLDTGTGEIHASRFANGRLAAVHVSSGLPDAIRKTAVPGYVRGDAFYTREDAMRVREAEIDALLLAA